jgi:uncharacterized membrane protein
VPQSLSNLPDVTTFAANVVVFLAAIGATVAGALSAVKVIKKSWLETVKEDDKPKQSIASATLVESTTMLMWSESNRAVSEELSDVKDELKELRFVIVRLTDTIKDHRP